MHSSQTPEFATHRIVIESQMAAIYLHFLVSKSNGYNEWIFPTDFKNMVTLVAWKESEND